MFEEADESTEYDPYLCGADIPSLLQLSDINSEHHEDVVLYSNCDENSTLTCVIDTYLSICNMHQLQQLKQGDIAIYIPDGDNTLCRPVCIMNNPDKSENRVDIYDGENHLNVSFQCTSIVI